MLTNSKLRIIYHATSINIFDNSSHPRVSGFVGLVALQNCWVGVERPRQIGVIGIEHLSLS